MRPHGIDMLSAQPLSHGHAVGTASVPNVKVGAISRDKGLRMPWDFHMPRCSACCMHSLCTKHLVVMECAQPLSTVLAASWGRAVSPGMPSNKCTRDML